MVRRSSQGWAPRPWRLVAPLASALLPAARAQIRVMSPEALVQRFSTSEGRIDGSTATFGAPFYGQRLLGRLVYGEPKTGHQHCRGDDYDVPSVDSTAAHYREKAEAQLLHIVVVRRGKCSFVTKVKVAQDKGAHAVVIVDKEDSTLTARDIRRIIVADDGYGTAIEIPSLLISAKEGDALINLAKDKNEEVIVELAWSVPTDHVVLVDLWTSSASQESLKFLRDWAPKRRALNDAIKFIPHFAVFRMQENDYHDLCYDAKGEYCAEDPDGSGPITGSVVLWEDVRQLCIHEKYKVKRDDLKLVGLSGDHPEYAKEYWEYMEKLLDACPLDGKDDKQFGKVCSHNLMKTVGIDVDKIEACVRTDATRMLKEQRANTAWSPRALRVNGWRYTGAVEADLVTRAICAGFVSSPAACKELIEPVTFLIEPSGGVSFGSLFLGFCVIVLVALAALVLYKRSLTQHIHSALREEVMLEVQAQMESYKQLS